MTLRAFANMELELGPAHEPLMKAVIRVADQMNAQGVAMTLRAFSILKVQSSDAMQQLLRSVIRVRVDMISEEVDQAVAGVRWAHQLGGNGALVVKAAFALDEHDTHQEQS